MNRIAIAAAPPANALPTLAEAIAAAAARLAAAGIEEAGADARLLARHVLGLDRTGLLTARERRLGAAELARLDTVVSRRAEREPVSRIIGRREFWSLEFELSDATLDPRPDSETVVEAALDLVADRAAPLRLLDLGTGSGCLLLALLHELPAAWGLGLDRSEAAARTARHNARCLGLAGRARFVVGDWAAPLGGSGPEAPGPDLPGFDLVVANPPYVAEPEIAGLAPEVARFDPRLALAGGADGLEAYRRIAPALPRLIRPGGHAVLEIGADQAAEVTALLAATGLRPRPPRRDLSGLVRCVIVQEMGQKRVGIPNGCR